MRVFFLLKIRLIVSVNLRSPPVSTTLVDSVVSVFVPGVVFVDKFSEQITRAFVGVNMLDLPPWHFKMALIEGLSEYF